MFHNKNITAYPTEKLEELGIREKCVLSVCGIDAHASDIRVNIKSTFHSTLKLDLTSTQTVQEVKMSIQNRYGSSPSGHTPLILFLCLNDFVSEKSTSINYAKAAKRFFSWLLAPGSGHVFGHICHSCPKLSREVEYR